MANNNGFLRFINFIAKLIDDRIVYKNLKSDEIARKTTSKFGKSAIGYSIFFAVLGAIGALIVAKGVSGDLGVIVGFFAIVIGIVFLLVSAELLLFAISHTVKQLILNRKAISWIALVFLIVAFAAVGFTVLSAFSSI